VRGRASLVLAVDCVWRGIRVGIFESGVRGVVGGPEAGVLGISSICCYHDLCLEHAEIPVRVLTGRGAIIGNENILNLLTASDGGEWNGEVANKRLRGLSRRNASFGVSSCLM